MQNLLCNRARAECSGAKVFFLKQLVWPGDFSDHTNCIFNAIDFSEKTNWQGLHIFLAIQYESKQ